MAPPYTRSLVLADPRGSAPLWEVGGPVVEASAAPRETQRLCGPLPAAGPGRGTLFRGGV